MCRAREVVLSIIIRPMIVNRVTFAMRHESSPEDDDDDDDVVAVVVDDNDDYNVVDDCWNLTPFAGQSQTPTTMYS